MEVKNLSWKDIASKRFNNPLLPESIGGLLVGKSRCGKTTLLLNLLLRPGWLDFNNLQVYGKSLFQPEYEIIKKAFEEKLPKEAILRLFDNQDEVKSLNVNPSCVIEEMAKSLDIKSDMECKFFETSNDVPDPRDLDRTKKNLMIFDDLLLEKQNKCEKYYIRGRHSNIDCFYLSQNYFELPRRTIRQNANFICLFPQDSISINSIYHDHVSIDMSKEEFKKLCKTVWEQPHGFVTIDLTSNKYNGKYRSGLDNFYVPFEDKNI